jgi:hypothetical protein
MQYEIINVESENQNFEHVIITREDGSMESFPVNENNPRYQQFLQDLENEENN